MMTDISKEEAPTLLVESPSTSSQETNVNIVENEANTFKNDVETAEESLGTFCISYEEVNIAAEASTMQETSEQENQLFDLVQQQKKQIEEYQLIIQRLESSNSTVLLNCKELEHKLEQATKQKENAIKEKESMVIRYAVSEKSVLQQQNTKDAAEKRAKDLQREHDLLQHKLTMMGSEKARICQMLDKKGYELKASQQETERIKSDLNALETKLKWSQNSLKNELELRKDTEIKLETLQNQVQDYINDADKAKKDADEAIKEFHTSQDNRAHVLDAQNKEQQASLIMLRHESDDREQQVARLQHELDKTQRKSNNHMQENNKLSQKVQRLEAERAQMEAKIAELRNCADQQRQDAADLHVLRGQLEQYKLQLCNEQKQRQLACEQTTALKTRNADLSSDMQACRAHENELLAFTQQLTDKNVVLQSEFTNMETRLQQMTYENGVLSRAVQDHATRNGLTTTQMVAERKKLTAEVDALRAELETVKVSLEKSAQELADQQGENAVLKRKHELSLREVNKELAQCRKKIEQYESSASSSSSTTSLNTVNCNGNVTPPPPEEVKVIQPESELDRHVLIEHIAKLQRISAKKSEKLDFMEEHVRTLVGELQKKSRLLQHYIKREQQGTMSSNKMDSNKADLAKQSGIMASMYGAKIADENLSIEQVLDINRKLYAILEDALLKNITLKENIDTLGAEIERLQHSIR